MNSLFSRRRLMGASFAGTAALVTGAAGRAADASIRDTNRDEDLETFQIKNGRIRQSVMGWCFNPMSPLQLAKHCREIGIEGIEGISAQHYPAVRKLGLKVSLVGSHGFAKGPVNPDNHAECKQKLMNGIDLAAEIGAPGVITFTGMTEKNIGRDQSVKNCLKLWKEVLPHAEKKGINLCLEHLNSRDDSHPMKGHPGYFGDDVDFCVELIREIGSPRMKLLFDVYHVQIMNGDVIRRINSYKDDIGHYHTAGNPGRGELDENQEINYPAIMRAILKTGYSGYVAQEFIPTWKDPVLALRHAARVCDV